LKITLPNEDLFFSPPFFIKFAYGAKPRKNPLCRE
jgi:hypothetical protein